jgi:hypothetical protein
VPNNLVPCVFLGRNVGGGVIGPFQAVLKDVEGVLRQQYALQNLNASFYDWCGIHAVGGFRPSPSGYHGHGVAVDLNYSTNGYSVSRTGKILGGEAAGADLHSVRVAFMEAADRICAEAKVPCDLAARKAGESTGDAWDRWHLVSDAIKAYFAPYYSAGPELDTGHEPVLPNVTIPEQVAKDYQAIRVPLVIGNPSARPRTTRNPARGLMDLPKHVVVAMCDVGKCRWGAIDFGSLESGDIMHFDRPGLSQK